MRMQAWGAYCANKWEAPMQDEHTARLVGDAIKDTSPLLTLAIVAICS